MYPVLQEIHVLFSGTLLHLPPNSKQLLNFNHLLNPGLQLVQKLIAPGLNLILHVENLLPKLSFLAGEALYLFFKLLLLIHRGRLPCLPLYPKDLLFHIVQFLLCGFLLILRPPIEFLPFVFQTVPVSFRGSALN